ncbi:MAG TPA: hypothetical protein VMW47_09370 [Verrucomicrobiae bacterium]|nr:hypothetical protein [Verrucomicrobiae bacterium]
MERTPTGPPARSGNTALARRPRLVALLAATAVGVSLTAAGPAATPLSPRHTRAQAVRLADQPLRLGAVGALALRSASVRSVRGWGPPYPIGVEATALVWRVTFRGWFRVDPCVAGPVTGVVRPGLLCATRAAEPAVPGVIACPALPRWPRPPPPCFGSWHRTATVSIADATGGWLGVAYGPPDPARNGWPPPLVIGHPRSGQAVVLVLGQLLVLGPPVVPRGGRLSPYRSSAPTVLAPIPPDPVGPPDLTAFLAETIGSSTVSATWQPVCSAGQACPQLVLLVRVPVRVMVPVDIPPGA